MLTGWGSEYRGAFDQACTAQAVRHTYRQRQHTGTKGAGQRLQGSIISELRRMEFRHPFFTPPSALQTTLHRYLEFHHHGRRLVGYRTAGRPPAA